jgi:hypothetical protein
MTRALLVLCLIAWATPAPAACFLFLCSRHLRVHHYQIHPRHYREVRRRHAVVAKRRPTVTVYKIIVTEPPPVHRPIYW